MEQLGRVFLAVPLPSEVRLALEDRLASVDIPGRVAPAQNWHLTIRFLGSITQVAYERFLGGLAGIGEQVAFPVRLTGLGAFPNPARATVVWVGVGRGDDELIALNEIAEEAARSAGLDAEERPFHSHLTLSRVRPPEDVRRLMGTRLDLGWTVDRVIAYRSHLGGGPARYEPLDMIELGR